MVFFLPVRKGVIGYCAVAMLKLWTKSRALARLLAALFVLSAVTTAGAAQSHRNSEAAEHHARLSGGVAGVGDAGNLAQAPLKHDGGHSSHCAFDAHCVTGGAWSTSGQVSVMPPMRRPAVAVVHPAALPDGLRPPPELRPPRHDR